MLRGLFLKFIDEAMANILLHRFLWFGRRPPVRGPDPETGAPLFSGELAAFYSPRPEPLRLDERKSLWHESAESSVWDYRFQSETRTSWPKSDQVWCRHWKPKRSDQGITVVGVDGIVQLGSRWFGRLAAALAPRGIDVLAMDAPFNYRRTPLDYRPGQLIIFGDVGHQLAVTRQAVLDLWRVVVSLQRQGRRVGLVGVSYGGWLTLLVSLLADDVEFLIALAPPVDIVRMLREGGTIVRGIRRGIGPLSLDRTVLERMAKPVIPSCWPTKLDGRRISLHAARYDRLVSTAAIEELARSWNTKFTMHAAAHFSLAVSPRISPIVAEEVCEFAGVT
jgi:hypothetical protein